MHLIKLSYSCYLVIFCITAFTDAKDKIFPLRIAILPKNTRMVIPKPILEEFKKDSKSWNKPSSYLSRYYSFAGPSLREEDQDEESTYYFPLSRADGEGVGQAGEIVLVDIMNLTKMKEDENTFITVQDGIVMPFIFNEDAQTEGGTLCIKCVEQDIGFTESDKSEWNLENIIKVMNRARVIDKLTLKMKTIIINFCDTCGGKINDFVNYVEKRSQEEKIPSEIIFALMYKESKGSCSAINEHEVDASAYEDVKYADVGILQLNTENSTELKECIKGDILSKEPKRMKNACKKDKYISGGTACNPEYKIDVDKTTVCLNNPYCNFEEALNVINCKWLSVHKNRCKEDSHNPFSLEMKEICKNQYKV